MRPSPLVAFVAVAFAFGAAAQTVDKKAEAAFLYTQGKEIGTAKLMPTPDGVLISVDIAGLPAGEHAFHIHEKGECHAKDGFKSAGGHFAPAKEPHGYYGTRGHHAGDMPNQFVSQDGRLRAEVHNAKVRLTRKSLLDQDGSALVHAKADDYRSQPSGDAGDRIACAVIKAGQ